MEFKIKSVLLWSLLVILLSGCGAGGTIKEKELLTQDVEGKTTITILVPNVLMDIMEADRKAYNDQNRGYQVELQGYSISGAEDMYTTLYAQLGSENPPDILYLVNYKDIWTFQEKRYLADLMPYLEAYSSLQLEDYNQTILDLFRRGDALYAIPEDYSIFGLAKQWDWEGEDASWTVEEFLDWLQEHPGTKACDGLSKTEVLKDCLMNNLAKYVDISGKHAVFDSSFVELLERIGTLETDEKQYWDTWRKFETFEDYRLEIVRTSGFDYLSLPSELVSANRIVYKGYPGEDGGSFFYEMDCYCLLEKSQCKNGAIDFLTFIANGKRMETTQKVVNYSSGYSFFTKTSLFEESRREAEITGEVLEQITQIQLKTKADTLDQQVIRGIILEEAQAYFAGDKSAEDTAAIIRSRVQLYLDEE